MSGTQATPEILDIDDAPVEHQQVFKAMSSWSGWGGWEPSKWLATEMPPGITLAAVKAAGAWLGDRMMVVSREYKHPRLAVCCRRGRWATVENLDLAIAFGTIRWPSR